MAYDYIKRTYAFQPEVGRRVRHTVTTREGVISRENKSQGHYVQVKFDGQSPRASVAQLDSGHALVSILRNSADMQPPISNSPNSSVLHNSCFWLKYFTSFPQN